MDKTFKELYEEIVELTAIEPKDIPTKFMKLDEEKGELSAEILKLLGETYKPYNREELLGEMADALQVLLSIYVSLNKLDPTVTIEEVFRKMKEKNQKWRDTIPTYTKLQPIKQTFYTLDGGRIKEWDELTPEEKLNLNF